MAPQNTENTPQVETFSYRKTISMLIEQHVLDAYAGKQLH